MYDDVLVPTDGSDSAEVAIPHAVAVATVYDATVHALSVVDERSSPDTAALRDAPAAGRVSALEAGAEAAVDRVERVVTDHGLSCRPAVRHGVPAEAIHAYVTDEGIDAVAMGTHGRTGLDRLLVGSVTERVVRQSDVPVLTVAFDPERETTTAADYDRLLLPTDGSEAARAAIEHGVALADAFDATVHALSVVDVDGLVGAYAAGSTLPDLVDTLREGCDEAVETVETACADRDVDVITHVAEGTTHQTIQRYTDRERIDLIVMGTHGRTGLERQLLGSVTARTIRTSEVPVLAVR